MRRATYWFFSGGFEISGNAASFSVENEKKTIVISSFLLVRSMGLEPIRSPIRPSNVRVCLFRHDRKQDVI